MRQPISSSHPPSRSAPSDESESDYRWPPSRNLDHLARLAHRTRQHVLRQLISAAPVSDSPLRPDGPDATSGLNVHTQLTYARSIELVHGSAEA